MSYFITGDYGPTLTLTVEEPSIEQPVIQTVYEGYDLLVLVLEPFTNLPDRFDLQRKLSTDSQWESVLEDSDLTEERVNGLGVFAVGNGGLLTDVRIRTRSSDGSEISDWTTAQGTPRQYPSVPEDSYSIDAKLFNIGDNLPAPYVYKSVINTSESDHTASDYTVVDAPPIGNSFENTNSDIGAVVFNRDTGVGNRIRTFNKLQYTGIARLYLSINETTTEEVLSAFGVTISETGTGEDTSFRPFAVRPSGTTIAFGNSFTIQGASEGTIVYVETDYDVNSKEIRFRGWKEGDTIPENWTSVIINEFVPVGSGYNGIFGTVNNSSCNVQIHSRTIDGSTPVILDENIGDWSDPSTFETALTPGSVGDWSNETIFETELQPGDLGDWSAEATFETNLVPGTLGDWSTETVFETNLQPGLTGEWSLEATFETNLTPGSVGNWSDESNFETNLEPGSIGDWSDSATFETPLQSDDLGDWSDPVTFETELAPGSVGNWSNSTTFETSLIPGTVGDWSNEAVFETDLQPGDIGAWSDEAIFQTDLSSGSVGEWSNAATFETSETPWVTINSSSESPSYPVQHSFSEPGTYRIRVIGRKDGRETISPSITITIE